MSFVVPSITAARLCREPAALVNGTRHERRDAPSAERRPLAIADCWPDVLRIGSADKDKLGSSDGITKARFTGGVAGKSKLTVAGKGVNLPGFTPVSGTRFFHATTSVIAQLRELGGDCYESAFTTAQVTRNSGEQLAAKK